MINAMRYKPQHLLATSTRPGLIWQSYLHLCGSPTYGLLDPKGERERERERIVYCNSGIDMSMSYG